MSHAGAEVQGRWVARQGHAVYIWLSWDLTKTESLNYQLTLRIFKHDEMPSLKVNKNLLFLINQSILHWWHYKGYNHFSSRFINWLTIEIKKIVSHKHCCTTSYILFVLYPIWQFLILRIRYKVTTNKAKNNREILIASSCSLKL